MDAPTSIKMSGVEGSVIIHFQKAISTHLMKYNFNKKAGLDLVTC